MLRHAITIADNGEIPRLTGNVNSGSQRPSFVTLPPIPTCTPVLRCGGTTGSYRDASHPALNLFAIDKRLAEQAILIIKAEPVADCPTVAIESRKHAARRPDHRYPAPGRSLLPTGQSGCVISLQRILYILIPAEIQQVVPVRRPIKNSIEM